MVTELIPLLDLGRILLRLAAPPSIRDLIARLDDAEEYEVFVKLVKCFTPEAERDILSHSSPSEKICAFAQAFEHRYFPLEEGLVDSGEIQEYAEFTRFIPVIVSGMSYDDYHEIASNYRNGVQLITYLLADPHEPVQQCHSAMPMAEAGARVALYDACRSFMPADILDRVSEDGLSNEEAHRLFDNSYFKAVAHWSDRLNCCTNNFFLDTDYEMLCQGYFPEWDAETVEGLKQMWLQAEAIEAECGKLWDWLEKDPRKHFEEILYFMERGRYVAKGGPDANAVQMELALEP